MKKVMYLVTGAAGHLGLAVVKELVSQGEKVRALVLDGDSAARCIPNEAEICYGNILNDKSLEYFFRPADDMKMRVIHCAGIVSTSSVPRRIVHDVNVNGTKNIIDWCRKINAEKLLYVSSVHALPVLKKGRMMDENTVIDPKLVHGPYAKTKAEATCAVLQAAEQGLNTAVVFPGGIIGPEDHGRGYMTKLFIDYLAGKMKCGIAGGFDFVDVRDAAKGVIAAARAHYSSAGQTGIAAREQTGSGEAYWQRSTERAAHHDGPAAERYLLTNRYISIPELFKMMQRASGGRKTSLFFSPPLIRLLLPLCALYYRIRSEKPLFNAYSIHTLTCNSLYSHEKAAAQLGYTVRPLEETVRDTVRWVQDTFLSRCKAASRSDAMMNCGVTFSRLKSTARS